jgi:hypothetical protein
MSDLDAGGGLSVTPEKLKAKLAEIEEIDQQLDAASGSEAAGRRALANQLAESNKEWKKPADQIIAQLNKTEDPDDQAAIFYGIVNSLTKEFKTKIDAYLDQQVQENKVEQVTLTAEELNKLQSDRRENVDQYRALRTILEMFGSDVSGIKEPKKRTGSRGPRGPQVLKNWEFYIDGKHRPDTSLSIIANTVTSGDPLNWKTADLRNFLNEKLAETGHSLENPPTDEDGFEFELPNGKMFKAVPGEPESVEDSNGEEPEDDDDVEDETEDSTETVEETE